MWWPFKSKYEKLKRQDLVNAVVELTQKSDALEEEIRSKTRQIEDLFKKGKEETNRQLKIVYAKKIGVLKAGIERDTQRIMYLLYNVNLLEKLKETIEDNEFLAETGKINFSDLLKDQKGLAKFLNKSLNRKISEEEMLTSSDEMFQEIQSSYEPNQAIYGVSSSDDESLAIFELDEVADIQLGITSQPNKTASKDGE